MAVIALGIGAFAMSQNSKNEKSPNSITGSGGYVARSKPQEVAKVMSEQAISIKERQDAGESDATFEKTAKEIEQEETKSKFDNSEKRTFVKIPYKMPIPDPNWIIKKFKGQSLSAEEIDDYMKWKYQQKLRKFKSVMKAPEIGAIEKVHRATVKMKVKCEVGASCTGWNKAVYEGVFDRCGPMDPFIIWKQHVREKEFDESLELFMDLFESEAFEQPFGGGPKIKQMTNKFFQAKYGMFTCHGSWVQWGTVDYDHGLIERWEKPKALKRTWNLAMMYLLQNKTVKIENLNIGSNYKKSPIYKKMMAGTSEKTHQAQIRLGQAKNLQARSDENKRLALEKKKQLGLSNPISE